MKPTGPRPNVGGGNVVQQKAAAAAQSAKQGAVNEAQQILRTAASQVTGADRLPMMPQAPEGIGQSNPNIPNPAQYDDLEAYRQKVTAETNQRMGQLKQIIENEMQSARAKREQEQQAIMQAQAAQMEQGNKEKEEEQKGFMAMVSRAAKRVKGRLGQVGKGKMEKGRAASG